MGSPTGMWLASDSGVVADNTLSGNGVGIWIGDSVTPVNSKPLLVQGNTITAGKDGIVCDGGATVSHNTVIVTGSAFRRFDPPTKWDGCNIVPGTNQPDPTTP
jgi:parallel beta-helix repeat protein